MNKHIGIGILFFAFISCQYVSPLGSDLGLTAKIEAEIKSDSETIDLSSLNSFEWDELLILGPYSSIDRVEEELHLDLENIRENGIEYSDDFTLLVFILDKKSIKISEVQITAFANVRQLINRDKAIFVKTDDGIIKLVE